MGKHEKPAPTYQILVADNICPDKHVQGHTCVICEAYYHAANRYNEAIRLVRE